MNEFAVYNQLLAINSQQPFRDTRESVSAPANHLALADTFISKPSTTSIKPGYIQLE